MRPHDIAAQRAAAMEPRRVVFDFEFVEGNPCHPISLGMAAVDGGSLYVEWPDAAERAQSNPWLAANVAPYLDPSARFPVEEIRRKVVEFLGDGKYELYASYGAYDFFLLSQLTGGFQGCPANFPYSYRDTAWMNLPRVEQVGAEHNALADAQTVRNALEIHLRNEVARTPTPRDSCHVPGCPGYRGAGFGGMAPCGHQHVRGAR